MCVIIIKPAGAEFDEKDLETCYDNNPDGVGYMFASEGRVVADKFVPESYDEFKEAWDRLKDIDAIFHLRYKTTGTITKSHCHPFRVLRKNKNHPDMFFMHNGTFKIDHGEGENDTIAFKNQILKPLLALNPLALENEKFVKMIEGMDGWSRMAFLTGEGKMYLTREKEWTRYDGVLLSNSYSVKEGHRNPPPTTLHPTNTHLRGKTTLNTTTNTVIRGGTWVKKTDGDGYEYVSYEYPAERVVDISAMSGVNPVNTAISDIPDTIASMGETYLLEWCKEELDDVVATLMTQYTPEVLGDYLAMMGISFNMSPMQEDVEYLVQYYPEETVNFIREEYHELSKEYELYKGALNVN